MKKKLLLTLLLLFNYLVKAQHPVFTHLTEKDGLPDIEFYNVLEDKKGFIWLAANKGLFRYDGRNFKNYTHPDKRGLSVFGLKLDDKGRIWCNNISGQYFYVEEDELHLFKDLKEINKRGNLASFLIYKKYLIIQSYGTITQLPIEKDKKLIKNIANAIRTSFIKNDTLFLLNSKELLYSIDGKEFQKKILFKDTTCFRNSICRNILYDDIDFFYSYDFNKVEKKARLIKKNKDKIIEIPLPDKLINNYTINFYVKNNFLWFCTEQGVLVYKYDDEKLIYVRTFFKGTAVTSVIKDRNNNYWFTTKEEGIYIMPNIYIEKYDLKENTSNVSAMHKFKDSSILFGSSKGHLAILDKETNNIKYIKSKDNQKVNAICSTEKDAYISLVNSSYKYNKKLNKLYNKSSKIKLFNVKDLSVINDKNILFALYGSAEILNKETKKVKKLKNKRAYTTYYSKRSKHIYVGYVDGLEMYDDNLKSREVLFNNKPIFAIDIDETNDGTIWVSTFKDGLIGIKNGKAIINYTIKDGLLSNDTGVVKGEDDILWFTTNKSLQVLNTKTGEFKTLTKKDGITSFHISDIVLFENSLFYSSNEGLFEVNREKAFDKNKLFDFYFTDIFINDERYSKKERYHLASDAKKIQFAFQTNGFLSEEDVIYKYRLLGASNTWNTIVNGVNQVTFNNLASGNYIFQLKAIHEINHSETATKSIQINIQLPFYKKTLFILVCFSFALFSAWYIVKKRIKKLRISQQQLLEKERLQKQIVTSKLESLQSQMNPHFIFNALNSIQNLVLKENKYDAYNYLTKFSLLMRENLNMSKKSFVDFEEETQMLTKYLELEKLRFGSTFEYHIMEKQKINGIKIPTMIIQPYIENAIKHGLLHKGKGKKKLTISFYKEAVLKCVIEDNGVGMEASKKIRKENGDNRESFSTKAINDRLFFLRNYYKTDIGIFYENVLEGTKVVIKIPYKLT